MKDVAAFNNKDTEITEGVLVQYGDVSQETKGSWAGGWDGGAGFIGAEE